MDFPRLNFSYAAKSEQSAPLIDIYYYASHYPDLYSAFGNSHMELLIHWLYLGISEGRRASRYFDVKYYHDRYEDLRTAFGSDPIDYLEYEDHWKNYGINEGRRGSLEFDPVYYRDTHFLGTDYPWFLYYWHWILIGIDEGLRGSLEFDPAYYLNISGKQYEDDIRNMYADEYWEEEYLYRATLDHWLTVGKQEGLYGSAETTPQGGFGLSLIFPVLAVGFLIFANRRGLLFTQPGKIS